MALVSRSSAWRLSLAFALAWLGGASGARAHGGFWRATRIHIDAAQPRRIVLQSALRGLVWSDDGGESFRWICAEAYGRSSVSSGAAVRMMPDAQMTLLTVSVQGGLHVSRDMCTFQRLPSPPGHAVRDAYRVGEQVVILALPNDGKTLAGSLFVGRYPDGALESLGAPLPESLVGTSVWASDDLMRLYVAGIDEGGLAVARTIDGGKSWTIGARIAFDATRAFSFELADLSAERVYLLVDEQERAGATSSHDALYTSDDGGETVRLVFADDAPLHDLARSPDGTTLMLSSARGLYRARESELLERGKEALLQVRREPVYGLRWVEGGLYAGLEEFANDDADAFGLGRSEDGGESFMRVMSVCDIAQHACGAESTVGERCGEVFQDDHLTGGGFQEDFLDAPRCAGEAPAAPVDAPAVMDAGAPVVARDAAVDAAIAPREAAPEAPREVASPPRAAPEEQGCRSSPRGDAPRSWCTWAVFMVLVWRARGARRRRISKEVE